MGTTIRLLMIEDSESDAALLLRLLKGAGHEIDSHRVDTAHALSKALMNNWDLIISDHSMPQFSGTDALKMVRLLAPDVPFIFVSGTIGEDAATDAMRSGAQDYVMKNNLKRLVPAVQRELRDAEERKERKRLGRRVQQLEKCEAIGRLVGGVSHDFNNMVGAILGWAEMGCQETKGGTRSHDRFDKIRQQSLRAGKLTSQLMAFAGERPSQRRNIDLNGLIAEEIRLVGKIIGENIHVRLLGAADLQTVFADSGQVEQIVMNLCLNARDAMPNGGELVIETKNVETGAGSCPDKGIEPPGSYALLSVSDTGAGIDPATLEHIFEPFFTTKESGKGTGLGLATVRGIARQHGGFAFAESEPGRGSSFRVYFPAIARSGSVRDEGKGNYLPRGTETILLAEDHDGLREMARELLEALGYQVLEAPDGRKAVELFKEHSHRIDLALMDVVMPDVSGPDAYTEMAALKPDVSVIFTTGYTPEARSLVSMVEKRVPILQKPYSLTSLTQIVRDALEHKARTGQAAEATN